jgi:glyoxylase-like metal-dependent hydrolase (beta-lactamase superfamily II)
MINKITQNIYSWSEFSDEKQMDFNGYLIIGNRESVIIDPPKVESGKLAQLLGQHESSPLQGILLTNIHHERESNPIKKLYSVPVWVNVLDAKGLDAPAEKTFNGGDSLLCDIEAIQLENQKSPGETAFYIKQQKIMLVGDAILGKVPGKLNMLPPDKYEDPVKAKSSLKKLLKYDFETLLVGDGTSILKDAKGAVASFLDS